MTGLDRHVQQNGCLSHPQDFDAPLRIAAQHKIAAYQQQYADNQNISFLPAIVSTSTRMRSIDMYNNDVGQESAQKFMKQTGDLKAATLYFAS